MNPRISAVSLSRLIAISAGLLAASAHAQSISLDLTGTTPTFNNQWASGADGTTTFSQDFAGAADFTVTSQSGTSFTDGEQFQLFCVELAQDVVIGSTTPYNIVSSAQGSQVSPYSNTTFQTGLSGNILESGIGSARAANLGILYEHVFGSSYDPSTTFGSNLTDYGAFQLAVWKLSQDDGFNLTNAAQGSPHFYITGVSDSSNVATSAMVTQAQTWLTWVEANPGAAQMGLDALNNDTVQDFIIPTASNFTQIPEPSGWALVAGAVSLVAILVRRPAGRAAQL